MQLTPERLYFDLGRLIADMPELASAPMTRELQSWLASANALVKSSGALAEALRLKVACENLDGPLRDRNAETIASILHRGFVKAEANAPREVRGSVVMLEGDLQAYKAVRKLLGTTNSDALLVDPDAAGKLLADYAILAPERVTVRLLADEARYKPSLVTGVYRWQERFGGRRDLMVRLARHGARARARRHHRSNGFLQWGGLEYAVTDHITAKLEYDHIDFGTKSVTVPVNIVGVTVPISAGVNFGQTIDLVKIGLNYKFGL
jgi:opacity protein-like surface antigen